MNKLSTVIVMLLLVQAASLYAQESPLVSMEIDNPDLQGLVQGNLNTSALSCNMSRGRLNRQIQSMVTAIDRTLRSIGYYESEINTNSAQQDSCWEIGISVITGPPVLVSAVNITISGDAESDREIAELIRNPGVRVADILNHEAYENIKSELISLSTERGYFAGEITRSVMLLDLENRQATLEIDFDSGPRFDFGTITINTGGKLNEERIRGLLSFTEGSPYHSNELVESTQNLSQSMYFRQISINPQPASSQDEMVPIIIDLTPRERRSISTGIGYATDSGPVIRLNYQDRYFNRRGHRLSAAMNISKVRKEFDTGFSIPLNHGLQGESVDIGAGVLDENTDSYESTLTKLSVAHRKRLGNEWIRRYYTNIEHEEFEFSDEPGRTDLWLFGMDLHKTRADNIVNPNKGWSLYGNVGVSHDSLLSDVSFLQTYIKGKYITSPFNKQRLLTRFELGATYVDDERQLPPSVRFFAGGDQSVRGYNYQSLGPVDSNGEVIGGKSLLVMSLEYDYQFIRNWRVAAFVDTGNAFTDGINGSLKESAGIGLRWISPIGAIRFDLAFPLDEDEDYRIHITMGPDL